MYDTTSVSFKLLLMISFLLSESSISLKPNDDDDDDDDVEDVVDDEDRLASSSSSFPSPLTFFSSLFLLLLFFVVFDLRTNFSCVRNFTVTKIFFIGLLSVSMKSPQHTDDGMVCVTFADVVAVVLPLPLPRPPCNELVLVLAVDEAADAVVLFNAGVKGV